MTPMRVVLAVAILGAALIVAGVALLAGPGWALITGGVSLIGGAGVLLHDDGKTG